ncbi:MAG: glycosyltransferase family 2 protein [Thermodesulfobacteriota bacterium]
MVDLSIIIVNWNTRDLLIQCLESIFRTARGVDLEVFVVDNGSTDGSARVVKERFPVVKVIENQGNIGFAGANNQALKISGGKYSLLLNPDTQVKGKAIEELISFMEAHPRAGISGVQLLNSNGSKQNSIANFPCLTTELLNKSLLRRLFPKKFPGKETNYSEPIEVDSVIGACMMVRRRAAEQVGILDEDYFLFLEETDWCYRMKNAGWKIYHVPQAEVDHFQGKSAEEVKKKARVEFYRSRYHFFRKNKGTCQWFILLIGLWIKLVAEFLLTGLSNLFTLFAVQKLKERFSVYAHLLWWHLKLCPEGMGLKPTE